MTRACVGRGILFAFLMALPTIAFAEESTEESGTKNIPPTISVRIGPHIDGFIGQQFSFDIVAPDIPKDVKVREILWDFGDRVQTTGEHVTHTYKQPGTFTIKVSIDTNYGVSEKTSTIRVFEHVALVLTDNTTSEDELLVKRDQAAKEGLFLLILRSQADVPESVIEEELTNQLFDARDALTKTNLIITWTSGSVGSNVISKFSQRVRQAEKFSLTEVDIEKLGIIILSETPFGVLAPTAQAAYDQMRPSYILLSKPQLIDILLSPLTADEVHDVILTSPVPYRLLGAFSARTIRDIGPTNFLSFSINFLVNRGVPINSITLILSLPIIATILAFSNQVIGIKAFGVITPALTTLSFLVMGLPYGLLVFSVVLIAGTITRVMMKKLHLLYLPRMALVLTSVSFAILILFGIGIWMRITTLLSFSVFPILILTLLAEEFIALQFKSGIRQAMKVTTWTIILAIVCYLIVRWELLRTIIISFPEVILLTIPINILLGRWTGLRLTEYVRFRTLLRHVQ